MLKTKGESKRGEASLIQQLPPSFEGEGDKGGEVDMTKRLHKTKEGMPQEAFAIIGNPEDTDTWKLPHHKKNILKALKGKFDIEKTVDWEQMNAAVFALLPGSNRMRRIEASPEAILEAASHLANHYRQADKPLPDTLAALV